MCTFNLKVKAAEMYETLFKSWDKLQDGTLLVINRLITPINGLKNMGKWGRDLYSPISGIITLLIPSRRPSCTHQVFPEVDQRISLSALGH